MATSKSGTGDFIALCCLATLPASIQKNRLPFVLVLRMRLSKTGSAPLRDFGHYPWRRAFKRAPDVSPRMDQLPAPSEVQRWRTRRPYMVQPGFGDQFHPALTETAFWLESVKDMSLPSSWAPMRAPEPLPVCASAVPTIAELWPACRPLQTIAKKPFQMQLRSAQLPIDRQVDFSDWAESQAPPRPLPRCRPMR